MIAGNSSQLGKTASLPKRKRTDHLTPLLTHFAWAIPVAGGLEEVVVFMGLAYLIPPQPSILLIPLGLDRMGYHVIF
jgi:hypothetical protein